MATSVKRPSGNPTDIVKSMENILSNNNSLSEVNLNNIENISQEVLVSFADAFISNTHIEVFSLANTHADDQVDYVDFNFLSGKAILAFIGSLHYNTTLVELWQPEAHLWRPSRDRNGEIAKGQHHPVETGLPLSLTWSKDERNWYFNPQPGLSEANAAATKERTRWSRKKWGAI